MSEVIVRYDGSWMGLLTAIFEVYALKLNVIAIRHDQEVEGHLFATLKGVETDSIKAERVKAGILKKVGPAGLRELYHAYLTELPGVELVILRTVRYYLAQTLSSRSNYGHADVLKIKELVKSVSRERHRMQAFVRFQQLQNNWYVALVEPDFNVLPLVIKHFKDRYADQHWIIYDVKRKYGIYYDLHTVTEITFAEEEGLAQSAITLQHAEAEDLYSDLWKRYFKSVNITERKNTKLHLQHVPRRYWKYLNEK